MSPFRSDAIIRDLPRGEILGRNLPLRWWGEFQADLEIHSEIAGSFVVPAGFLTDGASVPRPVWALLSDTDPDILYPSYGHDLLYSLNGGLPGRTLTREQCDGVIRELMRAIGAPAWKYQAVYAALRVGGAPAWSSSERHRKANSIR